LRLDLCRPTEPPFRPRRHEPPHDRPRRA
jgi:hypothetical protein